MLLISFVCHKDIFLKYHGIAGVSSSQQNNKILIQLSQQPSVFIINFNKEEPGCRRDSIVAGKSRG